MEVLKFIFGKKILSRLNLTCDCYIVVFHTYQLGGGFFESKTT